MSAILYKMNVSPPARAVMMVADILGVKYNTKEVNPILREQDTPELMKKNPMRTIPTWEEDGFFLADSHAIIIYLFNKYATSKHFHLYPEDERKRATVNQRLFFDCGVLFPRLRSVMAPVYGGRLMELSKVMMTNIEDAYRTLEMYLMEAKFLADDEITLADISIIATMSSSNGLHPISVQRCPNLKQWFDNVSEQEFCRRNNAPGALEHVIELKTLMEQNKKNIKNKF